MKKFLLKLYSLIFKTNKSTTPKENKITTTHQKETLKKEVNEIPIIEIENHSPELIEKPLFTPPLPENELERYLIKILANLKIPEAKIYWNTFIPCKPYFDIDLTEIDIALVTPKGAVIFECKNYTGSITGDYNSQKWLVTYPSGTTYNAPNAIKQNYHHQNAILYNITVERYKVSSISYLNCLDFNGNLGHANVIFHDNNINTIRDTLYHFLNKPLSSTEYCDLCNLFNKGMHLDKSIIDEHFIKLRAYIESSKSRDV